MKPELLGIHHVTAVTANARDNHRFYTDTLGMRLVKKTVNQDDVRAYHLFYADAQGSPGTDLTFFDWGIPHDNATVTTASVAPACESAESNHCAGGRHVSIN